MSEVFGKYQLHKQLGAGGMGEVFLATSANQAPVVLKRILKMHSQRPEFRSQFFAEVAAIAKLNHPCVAKVFELGEAQGQLFFTMEYLDGIDLRNLLKRGPISLPVCARVMHDALSALTAVHEATDAQGKPLHLLHRDISPANLFLCRDGKTRLIDFGLAKPSEADESHLAGTVAYLAPEVIDGQSMSAQSELFSLASVFYEFVVGSPRFSGESDLETLNQILESHLKPIDCPVPKLVLQWLQQCGAHQVDKRFGSAREALSQHELATFIAPSSTVASWVSTFLPAVATQVKQPVESATRVTSVSAVKSYQVELAALATLGSTFSLEQAESVWPKTELDALDALTEMISAGQVKSFEDNGEMMFQVVSNHAS